MRLHVDFQEIWRLKYQLRVKGRLTKAQYYESRYPGPVTRKKNELPKDAVFEIQKSVRLVCCSCGYFIDELDLSQHADCKRTDQL